MRDRVRERERGGGGEEEEEEEEDCNSASFSCCDPDDVFIPSFGAGCVGSEEKKRERHIGSSK